MLFAIISEIIFLCDGFIVVGNVEKDERADSALSKGLIFAFSKNGWQNAFSHGFYASLPTRESKPRAHNNSAKKKATAIPVAFFRFRVLN